MTNQEKIMVSVFASAALLSMAALTYVVVGIL